MKKIIYLIISTSLILSCFSGCYLLPFPTDSTKPENPTEETNIVTEPATEPAIIKWEESLNNPLVAEDIINAFREIGEKPEYIVSVELVGDRKTDLFIRREYKVTFDKGDLIDLFDGDERKWNHSIEWRITTEEWYEGEPEREQYPREYLVSIKFWTDDNSTNILQWSHTGNGKLQEGN